MGHGRDFSNMNGRTAWLMLLPLVLLSFMTPKVRSQSRSGKQAKTAGSKSAMKPAAAQQASKDSKPATEAPDKWVESTLSSFSVDSTHLSGASVAGLESLEACCAAAGFIADFEPAVLACLPLLDWLRTFGVIKDRRTRGNSINQAVRPFILEKSLPCPMP